MKRIGIVGNVVLDVVVKVDPEGLSEGGQSEANISVGIGGGLGNVGRVLSRLTSQVAGVGAVGEDFAGEFACRELPWRLFRKPGRTELSVIAEDGDRTILNDRGTARLELMEVEPELKRSEIIVIAYLTRCGLDYSEIEGLLNGARRAGRSLIAGLSGAACAATPEMMRRLVNRSTVVVMNRDEACWLMESRDVDEAVERLGELAVPTVVTAGPEGVFLRFKDLTTHFPARRVEVIKELGAGDAFLAGLSAGLAGGSQLEEAIEGGVHVATAWISGSL